MGFSNNGRIDGEATGSCFTLTKMFEIEDTSTFKQSTVTRFEPAVTPPSR